MNKPILTVTEYDFLRQILRWTENCLYVSPELFTDENNEELNISEFLYWVLDEPNIDNINTMIDNLRYKFGYECFNNKEDLQRIECLVDLKEREYLEDLTSDPDVPTQTREQYPVVNIFHSLKSKKFDKIFGIDIEKVFEEEIKEYEKQQEKERIITEIERGKLELKFKEDKEEKD